MKIQLKRLMQGLLIVLGIGVIALVAVYGSRPWYSRWGAAEAEVAAPLPGDELVPNPATHRMLAITIQATPEEIFPWLIQLGAERGGFYSYTPIEGLIACPITNAETIHPEWQNLQVGDTVKMCPGEFGPPPFEVAAIDPNRSLVLGHQEADGSWADTWQFVLAPIDSESTRFFLRARSTLSGGLWSVIDPGVFVMEYGLMHGVKERAER